MSNGRWFPNTTQMPNHFLDFITQDLTESELKVALYILRRTYGFQKESDRIALSQLVDGIKRQDGTLLDRGTGLSKSSVVRGVKGLEARGLLHVHRTPGTAKNAPETTLYSLAIEALEDEPAPPAKGSPKLKLPLSQIAPDPSANLSAEVVPNCAIQNLDQKQVTKEDDHHFALYHGRSNNLTTPQALALAARHTHDGKLNRDRFMAAVTQR